RGGGGDNRVVGRRHHCRAESVDRICWPSGHRADDQAAVAGSVPARRVSAGAWHDRYDRRAEAAEGDRQHPRQSFLVPRSSSHAMNYSAPIAYLYNLQKHGIKLGLETMAALMPRLDWPHARFRTLHIAGTNGKGSTAAMAAAGLHGGG